MKKLFTVGAAAIMALSLAACSSSSSTAAKASSAASSTKEPEASASASAETDTAAAEYKVTNKTGDKVTELYVYEDGSDKGDNYAGAGLEDGANVTIDKGNQPSDTTYTLEYVTEGGRDEKFTTLHAEEANINLLAEDAMTGSTPIEFAAE